MPSRARLGGAFGPEAYYPSLGICSSPREALLQMFSTGCIPPASDVESDYVRS